jgi:hypothetical protein
LPLDKPPHDAAGNVEVHDHAGILADHGVIRRISADHLVDDEKTGGKRVSTMAFGASSGVNGGMSVDLEESIAEAGLDPRTFVISPPFLGAVKFTAGALRSQEFKVGYDPIPTNPHHGEVWGNFTGGKKKWLQRNAEIFVVPKA